jgi:hypothetical protein
MAIGRETLARRERSTRALHPNAGAILAHLGRIDLGLEGGPMKMPRPD